MRRVLHKSSAGFTLLELLTVIAIVAILAAILMVVTPKILKQARGMTCASNLRSLYVASNLYVADWNHWPTMNIENVANPSQTGGNHRWFNTFLAKGYVPTHPEVRDGYNCTIADDLICPSNEENPGSRYPWMSSPYSWIPNYGMCTYWGSGGGTWVRSDEVVNPTAILFVDTLSNPKGQACIYSSTDADWNNSACVIPMGLHGGGAHAVRADGAVITVSPDTHPDLNDRKNWDPRYVN